MDRVGRVALLIVASLAIESARAGELSPPERVFAVTTADWTSTADGNRSSDILLTQAGGGSASPTWALVAPYVWAPMMDGTLGVNGNTANVNLSFSDLLDLVPDLNGAAMGHVEVGRGPRGLILDALFLELSPTRRAPLGGKVTTSVEMTLIEMLGTLRLIGNAPGEGPRSDLTFDLLGGLRYYDVAGEITDRPVLGPNITRSQNENWVDLVIGGRADVALTQNLGGFVRGDVGGFGIGTSSKLTWNVQGGFEYACTNFPGWSGILGYRVLDIDEVKYSGAQRFIFNMRIHGPFVALNYRF